VFARRLAAPGGGIIGASQRNPQEDSNDQ